MAEFLRKEPCPKCKEVGNDKSGDNLAVYDDGSYHCFACGNTKPSEAWIAEHGDSRYVEKEYVSMGMEFNDNVHAGIKASTTLDSKWYRGINPKVTQYFGVRHAYDDEGNVKQVLYPVTKKYEISGYKSRVHPKNFAAPYGEVGKECDMFGQHRFKTSTNICVITGGEHDQLAAYQMLLTMNKDKKFDPVSVVSSTVGETAAYKQAQSNYDFFLQFKKIVICMDSDEAGRAAAEKLAEVLPKGRAHIMKMRRKDPNAYLYNKETGELVDFTSEFVSDFWAAKPYVPQGVKSAAESFDEIEEELLKPRITLPPYMHKMQAMMGGGMIQGRIMNIIADTSVGKSTHVNRMVYHWIFNSPEVPTIVSLEATAGQYMLEMLAIHMRKNLRWVFSDAELIEYLKSEDGQRMKNELCFKEDGTPRFFLIDDRTGDIKDMEKQVEKLFKQYDSKLFVFDVLTNMLEGSSAEHIDDHMHFQRNMVKHGVTFVNVLHTRKPPNSGDGPPRKASEYDAKNSGTFVQSAAYNIVMNRNKLSDDPLVQNKTEVDMPKCRGGKTGSAGDWFYEFMTAECHDFEDYIRENPEALMKTPNF